MRAAPLTPRQAETVRVAAVFALALLLSVKGDGTFPLPASSPVLLVQVLNLVLTGLFAVAGVFLLRPDAFSGPVPEMSAPARERLAAAGCILFAAMSAGILQLSSVHYGRFGYERAPLVLGLVFLASMTALLAAGFGPRRPLRLLASAGLSTLLFAAVSIRHYPLHPQRSDMLLLIEEALTRFLGGLDPYTSYARLQEVPLTYLPGLWLSFLPGRLVGLDPRWTQYAALLLTAVVLYRMTRPAQRGRTAPLLALFVMTPYLVYRHELYAAVQWLSLALTFWALAARRPLAAGLAFGWSLSCSLFSWALAPLIAVGVMRRCAVGRARAMGAVSFGVAALIVAPFLIGSPRFVDCVIGYWSDKADFSGFNLGYWLLPLIGLTGLRAIQLGAIIGFTAAAWIRRPDVPALAAFAAGLLFVFCLFNSVVWVYFYPMVVVLLLAAVCLEPGWVPSSGSLSPEARLRRNP